MRRQTSSSTSRSSLPFLKASPEGVVISVRLQPRSSKNRLEGVREGSLRVRLTAPPVEGEANRALLGFLSEVTGVRKSDLEISAGHRSRDKSVLARGAALEPLEAAFSAKLS